MKWQKVGTGITKREVGRTESERELEAALRAMEGEDWTFEGRVGRPLEDYCERLLERKVRHGWPEDSPEGYALRALRLLRVRRTAAENGNVDLASQLAYELGELVSEAVIKARWERHALSGQKRAASLARARDDYNECRKFEAEIKWEQWKIKARDYWAECPGRSIRKVAQLIAKEEDEEGESPDYIRQKIASESPKKKS